MINATSRSTNSKLAPVRQSDRSKALCNLMACGIRVNLKLICLASAFYICANQVGGSECKPDSDSISLHSMGTHL